MDQTPLVLTFSKNCLEDHLNIRKIVKVEIFYLSNSLFFNRKIYLYQRKLSYYVKCEIKFCRGYSERVEKKTLVRTFKSFCFLKIMSFYCKIEYQFRNAQCNVFSFALKS